MARLTAVQKKKLDELAQERLEVAARLKADTARKAEIDAILSEKLPLGERTELGSFAVYLKPIRTVDKVLIETAFPVDKHPDYYKLAVDLDAVKADISANDLEAYKSTRYQLDVSEV